MFCKKTSLGLDGLGKLLVTCKHFVLGVSPHLHKKNSINYRCKKEVIESGIYIHQFSIL